MAAEPHGRLLAHGLLATADQVPEDYGGWWSWVPMAQILVMGSMAEVWDGKAELAVTLVPAGPCWQQGSAVPSQGSLRRSSLPCHPLAALSGFTRKPSGA